MALSNYGESRMNQDPLCTLEQLAAAVLSRRELTQGATEILAQIHSRICNEIAETYPRFASTFAT